MLVVCLLPWDIVRLKFLECWGEMEILHSQYDFYLKVHDIPLYTRAFYQVNYHHQIQRAVYYKCTGAAVLFIGAYS